MTTVPEEPRDPKPEPPEATPPVDKPAPKTGPLLPPNKTGAPPVRPATVEPPPPKSEGVADAESEAETVPVSAGGPRSWKVFAGVGIGIVVANSLLLAIALSQRPEQAPTRSTDSSGQASSGPDSASPELRRMSDELQRLRGQLEEVTRLRAAEKAGQGTAETVLERRLLADLSLADSLHAAGDWVGAKRRYYEFLARSGGLPYESQGLIAKASFRVVDCERELARAALGVPAAELPRAIALAASTTFTHDASTAPPTRPDISQLDHTSFHGATGSVVQRIATTEPGIYLYSVRAGQVVLGEVLEVLAEAGQRTLSLEPRAVPIAKDAIVDVDIEALPYDRVVEFLLGSQGLEADALNGRLVVQAAPERETGSVDWLSRAVRSYTRARLAYFDSPDVPRQANELARLELALDHHSEVIRLLDPLINRYRDMAQAPEMLWLLGRAQLGLQSYQEARTLFTRIERSFPDSPIVPDAMTWKARAYLADGGEENLERAENVLRYLLRKFSQSPTVPTAESILVEVSLASGDCGSAVELVRQLGGRLPDLQWRRLVLLSSECLVESGQSGKAIVELRKIGVHPEDRGEFLRAQVLMAEAYLIQGEALSALWSGKRAADGLSPSPLRTRALLALGRAARELGLAQDAERYLDEALAQGGPGEPRWGETIAELANLFEKQGHFERSVQTWKRLFDRPGFEARAHLGAARARALQGEPERALALARSGLTLSAPASVQRRELLVLIGDLSLTLKDVDGALKAFTGEGQ